MPDDFYDLLGIDEDATIDEVHAAYREKARQHHPDVNEDDRATRQFQVLKKAYEVLSSPAERERYDQLGHTKYVNNNLGGLPGIGSVGGSDQPHSETSSTARGYVWSGERTRQSPESTWYHGQRANPTNTTGGSTGRRRRYFRTAPNRGPTPGIGTIGAFLGGLISYAIGTWQFLTANRSGVSEFWEAFTSAGVDSLFTVITYRGFEISPPIDFATKGLADLSFAALFPIGGGVFAVASIIAAWQFQRREAVVVALAGNAPLLVLFLEYTTEHGVVIISNGAFEAVGVTLLFLVVLPVGSLLTAGILFKHAQP